MTQASARVARAFTAVKPQPAHRPWPVAVRVAEPKPCSEPYLQMRKLKYHVDTSVDGYLLDRVPGFDPVGDAARHLQHAYGIVLMGRNTYEAGLKAGVADPYPQLMSYVFSNTLCGDAGSQVEVVSTDAPAWVRGLKACPGKDLYLCGGARLAASLFRAGLIDEIVVKINPVLLGSGRRALPEMGGEIALVRESSLAYDDGTVTLTYKVRRDRPQAACR